MEIIYEDKEIIVCHKPSGIPVQTANIRQQDMISILQNYLAQKGEHAEVFVVHRLDQPVEGVIVFAKTKQAASALSHQMQQNTISSRTSHCEHAAALKGIKKYYLALVEGSFLTSTGVLEDYLLRDGKTNTSKVVSQNVKGAKLAKLFYRVKQEATMVFSHSMQISLVSIHLETGRHHQIRVQMAHAGHPLVGDKKYNPNSSDGYMPIGLCANKISFLHPATRKEMTFTIIPKGELFQKFTAQGYKI